MASRRSWSPATSGPGRLSAAEALMAEAEYANNYGRLMPRVSVITPAYEAEASIADTLTSVADQTYDDWELVVVDDASADATARLAEGVGDPRIRVIRSEANLGPAGARNLALDHAGGELMALLDADDRWEPQYLERQLALFDAEQARRPRVGIVACDAWIEGPEGRLAETYGERFGFPGGGGLAELLRANTIFVSAMSPRAVVEEVGRFSTECFGSEDHDMWLRIVEAGYRCVATREPLAIYRLSKGSISASALGMARTDEATYRRALARGRLNRRERWIARRALLVARSARRLEEGDRLLTALPLFAATAAVNPRRWPRWARLLSERRRQT
jgi:glycosyltransferase involved in cell wall biosynthesis